MKKLLVLMLCLTLIISVFAGCGGNTDTTSGSGTASNSGITNNDDYIDKETGEIINIGSPTTMKITPEEIGELSNPIVTGLEAWPTYDFIDWKEDAYGIIYDYEKCDGTQRHAKLVAAFVAGDSYDVIKMSSDDFPLLALKGLLQPLEKIMPVYDENYFITEVSNFFTLNGRCYGVNNVFGVDKYGVSGVNIFGVHYNQTLLDNLGLDSPMDYYERGEWTFDTFYKLCKATVEEYSLNFNLTFLSQAAVASNSGQFFEYTDTGAEMTLKDPETQQALEWVNKVYSLCTGDVNQSSQGYMDGTHVLLVERPHLISRFRKAGNYELGWVPFPKGPSGEGKQSALADAWGIGKGAKNIEGAMAFIAANAYRPTWYEQVQREVPATETRTEEEIALMAEAIKNITVNSLDGFSIGLYNFYVDSSLVGYAAAAEKYTPTFQEKLDVVMGTKKEEGAIDFEDQGVFDFDTAESEYPFVNVLADDKFTYGTEDVQSLKIDLTGVSEFAPILHTKPELFKLQNGGQYKVTFKLYVKDELPAETLAIAARTTADLAEGKTFGLTWLTPKAGEVAEVQVYINVNDAFSGDLAVVLFGSEAVEGLSVVIDDFHVELVSAE